MNKFSILPYLLLLFCLGLGPATTFGQVENNYFAADQLLRQQKYEQAYEKFYELHQKNPTSFIYLDKATECLINLKRYDKAIELTQRAADSGYYQSQAMIRLGEIYHISGEKKRAHSQWDKVLEKYGENQQINLQLARTLSNRQVFDRAITIYQKIRDTYSNSHIVTTELAATLLQAGRYEEAIQEYLQLVKNNPERMNYVQQRLIRFQDDNIYDVAILEISDFLETLSLDHPSYRQLQQLEVWLLMERNLYERALVTAQNYETKSPEVSYLLYSLGSKLLAAQKFALAERAYSYYIDNAIYSVKFRSMEELANVYRQWARYFENYNLGLSKKRDTLYQKAYTTLQKIRKQNPNYRRMQHVLVALSELSLDILHQPEAASQYLAELRKLPDTSLNSQAAYIEGRIHLYNEEYTRARIALTKTKEQQRSGELAEKARYYLALSDFYAGDYEFAKIQLNALERQNTSYFANDAVQLRLWIQSGLQADSTGKQLKPFAEAVEYFSQGKDQLASNKLHSMFEKQRYHPLLDNALLELSKHKSSNNVVQIYRFLTNYLLEFGSTSPLHERLLWEKARIADQLVTNKEMDLLPSAEIAADTSGVGQQAIIEGMKQRNSVSIPDTIGDLVTIYEEVLIHFPNGFYASFVRNRIKELQNIQT